MPEPTPPKGEVLFQSHGEPPPPDSDRRVLAPAVPAAAEDNTLTDNERAVIFVAAYDLDARMTLANSRLAMRARVTLRNDGGVALSRVALQVSSSLRWESASLVEADGNRPLALAQHLLDTDADHTGKANEAVMTLLRPLAPGASVTLDTFYSGAIAQDSQRLKHIGATAEQANAADWDAIAADGVQVRGFGNVMWYPVATPQLFLGDGAKLFQAVGQMKLRESSATVRLRLAVEYVGEPPVAAYFCGRRRSLDAQSDNAEAPTATGNGIAVAEFAREAIGFRALSLFVVPLKEIEVAPLGAGAEESSSAPAGGDDVPLLAVETADEAALPRLAAAVEEIAPMFVEWLGARPLSALTVIDHEGQPFADGPLLVAPVGLMASSSATGALVQSLTSAWVQTGQPWMDEGLAQFFALQWVEREKGRAAAVTQLGELVQALAVVEPGFNTAADVLKASPGQPLIAAADEMFTRRKAAAVWWMLRDLAGEKEFKQALQTWCAQPVRKDSVREQALAFEALLEKISGKQLGWFFNDWVLRDVGLPDLTIVDVTPRPLPAGAGHDSGWLVAVTVRNDGAAGVDVPLVIRSGTYSTTRRLRVSGFSSVTERVLVEAAPTEVVLNDGSTPEVRASVHTRTVTIRTD